MIMRHLIRAVGTFLLALPIHIEAEEEKKHRDGSKASRQERCTRLSDEIRGAESRLKKQVVHQFLSTKYRSSNRNPENEKRTLKILKSEYAAECR